MSHEFHSFYYDQMQYEPVTDDFLVPTDIAVDLSLVRRLIDEHATEHVPRYRYLKAAYDTRYGIFGLEPKPEFKPDNRLAADMAYNITQSFEGYFIGIPVTFRAEERIADYLADYNAGNHQEDVDAELSAKASIFGHSFEMLYQDEQGAPRSVDVSPMCSFMVYDDSVLRRPRAFVRYVYGDDGTIKGSYSDALEVVHFRESGGELEETGRDPHYFGDVPAVEYCQNSDRRGLFEGVLNLIEAYNRVLSEKANDIEYFSDAYMVIMGMELDDDWKEDLQSVRVLNLFNNDGTNLEASFLAKPDADAAQENLINRLEMLIFKMAMVPDITDESFSTASGTALKMRMMPMSNLARNKERKFLSGIKERLRLLSNYPNLPFSGDDWKSVEVTMHRNIPEDLASEAQVAGSLSGIVSEETQLSVLSCVDDPRSEMERKEREKAASAAAIADSMPTNRTSREPTMYEITSILGQRKRGSITYKNALAMMRRIGVSEEDAIAYLNDKDPEEGEQL